MNARVNNKVSRQLSVSRPRKWLKTLMVLLVCAVLMGIYFGVRYSLSAAQTMFQIKEIVFYGNRHLTDDELKAIMGIKRDESLVGISGKELAAKLLKSPWIRAVSIRKEFPHRLLVKTEEAAPLALLEMKGRIFFVDDRGDMLEEIKNDSVPFLPVISGDPFRDGSTFSEALNLVKSMKVNGFINTKDRVEIMIPRGSGPEDISMQVDGMFVKIGYGDYEEKLERLLELEPEIIKRGIPVDYIDLRFANRVVVKPVNEVIR